MNRTRKITVRALATVCAGAMLMGVVNTSTATLTPTSVAKASADTIQSIGSGIIDTRTEEYFDPDTVYRLTDTVTRDTDISVILSLDDEDTVLETYNKLDTDMTFSEYSATPAAMKAKNKVIRAEAGLVKKLNRSGVSYTMGETYDTLINGFEVTIKAGDYSALAAAVPEATLMVGEEYERCTTEVVTNDVDVYDTGIFDSSESKYKGDGVVVAVVDSGLDYTHSAFAVENFNHETLCWDKDGLDGIISSLHAAETTADLTTSDVYINEKVPYQYDYADKDTDVFPIDSEHGTHVSGIIAGNDDTITGVAPSAQLMMMKVFSDTSDGAKQSWILAALEDCVKLGVDVVNLSIGTTCGFSRETDKDRTNEIYDEMEEAGISVICAASNDYNATMGSEKNGTLGLTSNPDSGTVGAPSTYDAAMSVASVSGTATNYMLFGDDVIYFNEATDSTATTRSFFDDILRRYEEQYGVATTASGTYEIPYEVIPGLGRNSDYSRDDYTGEIVLVKRGTTTFEEKIRIAMNHNALGIVIYNNVSGTISMSIGSNSDAAACSISQDDGEKLIAAGGGTLIVSRSQEAGPFMSDFSSWGPTSDLKIKPEITTHGGEILSCVPGGGYERLSGTSMATPNMSGVAAIVRQYVKANDNNKFGLDGSENRAMDVATISGKLEMSTADIIYNESGIPYSVRKQGAGLANLYSAQKTDAYLSVLDGKGNETDKTKIELGDDRERSGVYDMSFIIKNIADVPLEYKVGVIFQTEGVSATYTSHGDTTVTQEGKTLDGTNLDIISVSGGTRQGDSVSVPAGGETTVRVKVTLSDEDKEYMDESFENGMYVEGFITMEQLEGTDSGDFVDLSVPVLGFYGDWTEAPIFDEEYYDTNADELNAGLDEADKLMPDAYATRVVGGLYDDYIAYLGAYAFVQDPSAVQIAADKDRIAMSNQSNEETYNINNIDYVYAGLLRNVKEIDITITEDATGRTIYTDTVENQRKSYGASSIYTSAIDMGQFSAYEHNLKNNTRYTVTLEAYIDYGYDEEGNLDKMHQDEVNKRNTFTFPLYIDYEAPVLTDVEFRKEYDSVTKKTSLYADLSIYDNHYSMAVQVGNVTRYTGTESYLFSINLFGNYFTPINSSFNSTSVVSFDLTDYMDDIKESAGYYIYGDGTYTISSNNNSFIAIIYDYALNSSIFEITIPDEVISMYFGGANITYEGEDERATVELAINETLDLTTVLNVYPSSAWVEAFEYSSSDESLVAISGQTVLALGYTGNKPVTVTVTAKSAGGGDPVTQTLDVIVNTDKGYTLPVVNSFSLKSYYVDKAFYSLYSDEMEIGYTGDTYMFENTTSLSMYPSERVTVTCDLQTYFPKNTHIEFVSSNSSVTSVDTTADGKGIVTAQKEGSATITATVYYDDPSTGVSTAQKSARVSITVKDPFTVSSIYLMSYKGLGGTVEIPGDRGITTIYEYAFSNCEYISKDLDAGDVIDDEDPYATKPWFVGENTIEKVIIPEGVKEIDGYAFANLTSLKEVVLPSTLTRIGYGAFYGCTALTTVTFSSTNNLQFINDHAFYNCSSLEEIDLRSAVAIGKYAFEGCDLKTLSLSRYCQSIAEGAFMNNKLLFDVSIAASGIKLGSYAFAGCSELDSVSINASVIPSYAFAGCTKLTYVTLGTDVSVINAGAFYGTNVSSFTVSSTSKNLETDTAGQLVYSYGGEVLQIAAPMITGPVTLKTATTTISNGAFALTGVTFVEGEGVTKLEDYAFFGCEDLTGVDMKPLTEIGEYAFYGTGIESLPTVSQSGVKMGAYAFAHSAVAGDLTVSDGQDISDFAFYDCESLTSVTVGDKCEIGSYAFYGCTLLESVVVGDDCVIGDYAFAQEIFPDYYTWYYDNYATYGDDTGAEYWSRYGGAYVPTSHTVTDMYGNELDLGDVLGDILFVVTQGDGTVKELLFAYDISLASSGVLKYVTIGAGTSIGTGAFANCSAITDLTLGNSGTDEPADVVVGDYAFYNCTSLTNYNFKKVSEIGAYAFSVMGETIEVMFPELYDEIYLEYFDFVYDINYRTRDDYSIVGFVYTEHTGVLSGTIDISGATRIDEYAFAYNNGIEKIILSDGITEIPAYAFYKCTGLKEVCRASGGAVNEDTADLTDIMSVGAYAFAYTSVSHAVLQDQSEIGDGAFYMCGKLATADNLENVRYIGAYAFAYTALGTDGGTIDLCGVEYIGDYAFAYIETVFGEDGNPVPLKVEFLKPSTDGGRTEGSASLKDMGENPFLGTYVDFSVETCTYVNGERYVETIDTYSVNDAFFVSSGVLYEMFPTGYMLVTYPVGLSNKTYTVEPGTVRISAHAFDGNASLKTVTLSSELTAIGDKAFYGCDNLSVVVFMSYYAPNLEEEFDEEYYDLYENYPGETYMAGYYPTEDYGFYYDGLGLVDYVMWSAGPNNYFYGANFIDYIGHIENKIVMVVPANGRNYDSFTLAQYFDTVIYGATAATSDTLTVIAMIEELPESRYVTLADSEDVYAALAAYNALSPDQQALVSNYSKLTACIGTLSWLEYDGSSETGETGTETEKSSSSFMKDNMWGLIIALVVLLAFIALLTYVLVTKKKGGPDGGGEATSEESGEKRL